MDIGIKKLILFLNEITEKTYNGTSGKQFEESIKHLLSKNNFVNSNFNKNATPILFDLINGLTNSEYEKKLKNLKDKVLSKNRIEIIKNPFEENLNKDIYIYISTIWITEFSWFFNNHKKIYNSFRN